MASQPQKVDINTATVEELEALSGIGHNRAVAIFEARKISGGFLGVSDLIKIPGIGPAILEQNLGCLTCSSLGNSTNSNRKSERETRSTLNLRSDSNPSSPSAVATVPSAAGSATSRHDFGHGLRSNCGAAMCATPLTPASSGGGKGKRRTKARTEQGALRHSLRHCTVGESSEEIKDRDSAAMVCDQAAAPDSDNDTDSDMQCSASAASQVTVTKASTTSNAVSAKRVPATRSRRLHTIESATSPTSPSSSICTSTSSSSYPPSNLSNGSIEQNGMECQDNSLHINIDTESMEHHPGCNTPDVSMGPKDEQFKTEIASSIQVLEKHLMKRKSNGEEGKELSPGKKPCWADDSTFGSSELAGEGPSGSFPSLRSTLSGSGVQTAALLRKQRIPSRSNPPPQLADWLKTFQEWSHAERLLALDEMIEQCEPTQVRHIMAVIEPQFQRDFISLLPKELALYVLSFLEPNALLQAAQTCRYWHILAEDNLLWREKCREEGINEATVFENRIRTRSGSISNSYARSPWKCLYLRQKGIEHNWRVGEIHNPKVLKGHDDHVITCLEFCGTRIVSGSDDNTLKVWSAVTGKCLRTLVGHTGGVWSSQMSNHIIISGSTDRTLKVWNADTGQCIHTLYGHTSTVRCMHLYNNQVVSGSRDATLRLWDVESGQCLHVLMGHVAAVRCVQYNGQRVVSGAYDYMVKVWDPDTEQCLFTLQGHTNRVYSLQFDGTHIVSGSLDTTIRVWDAETGNCVRTLLGHQSLTSGMELKDNILVSGNADSTVKVWDITTGQCLQTLQGPNKHQSAVTCLQFNKKFVITSSDDGTVKIWCLRTGDFLRNLVALDSGGSGGVVWRIRSTNTKLVCAVGSRNGTEETKLLVLDFDVDDTECTPYRKRVDSCSSNAIETRV